MSKFKTILPYIQILAGFLGSLLLLFIIFDSFILPAVINEKQVVKVPKLIGLTYESAIAKLEENNLSYSVVAKQFNAKYPENYVIQQIPSEGSEVKETRQILLTLSKGTGKTQVPYLIGKEQSYAINTLQDSELEKGTILYEVNDSIPSGVVIRQNPGGGQMINYGESVDLVISSGGIKLIEIPDLTGKSITEAEITLAHYNLKIGQVTYIKNETFLPNTVYKQHPDTGDSVATGTLINIFITK